MIKVELIESAGPDGRARRLVLSDHDSLITAGAVVRAVGIERHSEWDPVELKSRIAVAEAECGNERALRLVGYRERSSLELKRRLVDDGYPEALAETITGRFVDFGYVDDVRFASSWARSRAASGMGRRRIASELARKGIDDATADAALAEVLVDDELDRAVNQLRNSATPTTRAGRDKLMRRLVGRGYSYGTARAAVDRLEPCADTDEPFVGE